MTLDIERTSRMSLSNRELKTAGEETRTGDIQPGGLPTGLRRASDSPLRSLLFRTRAEPREQRRWGRTRS